jgi:hypothetical protein
VIAGNINAFNVGLKAGTTTVQFALFLWDGAASWASEIQGRIGLEHSAFIPRPGQKGWSVLNVYGHAKP